MVVVAVAVLLEESGVEEVVAFVSPPARGPAVLEVSGLVEEAIMVICCVLAVKIGSPA